MESKSVVLVVILALTDIVKCEGASASSRSPSRKGEGAPWGHYFSPGFGGLYTANDFRPGGDTVLIPGHHSADLGTVLEDAQEEQQVIQEPDFSQVTQGPELDVQVTQGQEQETQGPELPDVQQMTTPVHQLPVIETTTKVPDTESTTASDTEQIYTTPGRTTGEWQVGTTTPQGIEKFVQTTNVPEYTTAQYVTHDNVCRPNPAAAGYPKGTQLICTVELCRGEGGGVKGVKGHGHGIKRPHNPHSTTLVCRPFNGCEMTTYEPNYQTTEKHSYTTPDVTTMVHYTTPSTPEETTPGYTTEVDETPPHYTTPQPGIKGRHPHVPHDSVKGGHFHDYGVKAEGAHKWESERIPTGVKEVKGRPHVVINGQVDNSEIFGIKRRPIPGVKNHFHRSGSRKGHYGNTGYGHWMHRDQDEQGVKTPLLMQEYATHTHNIQSEEKMRRPVWNGAWPTVYYTNIPAADPPTLLIV